MNSILTLEAFCGEEVEPLGPLLPSFAGFETLPEPMLATEEEGGISEAYDLGYQTGWAARDLELQQSHILLADEFQETLHALSFTWEDARAHVVSALVPLLRAMVSRVLPELAKASWGESVLAELLSFADEAADTPVTLALAPTSYEILGPHLKQSGQHPFHLVSDPELGQHQAAFRLGKNETLLDLDGLLAAIEQRLAAALTDFHKDFAHG